MQAVPWLADTNCDRTDLNVISMSLCTVRRSTGVKERIYYETIRNIRLNISSK